jgi:hypothetical protein
VSIRRIFLAATVMVALMMPLPSPAFAEGQGCHPVHPGCASDFAFGDCVSFLAATEGTLPIGGGQFSSDPGDFAKAFRPVQSGQVPNVGCPKDTLPPP